MKIAVLSGKGGVGKTFISVNLASVASKSVYIDCDVEEPNGKLFFRTSNSMQHRVCVKIPEFNTEQCDGCRRCVDFCHFNALMYVKEKPHLFKEICHSCGGCKLVCPKGAVKDCDREVGMVEETQHLETTVVTGILNIGEASGVPVIQKAIQVGLDKKLKYNIIDCPPGSACTVLESVTNADYCILVAEPTLFSFENFLMVYELVRLLKKPFGVVLNKVSQNYEELSEFLENKGINLLMQIPYDYELGQCCTNGTIASEVSDFWKKQFMNLLRKVEEEVNEKVTNS